jgi:hypothetical protein
MYERKPVQEAGTGGRRCPVCKPFGLLLLAGLMAQPGLAQAAGADGPADVPSAMHALAMLAVFFVLASIRVTWTEGRLRMRFELSPIPRSATAKQRA